MSRMIRLFLISLFFLSGLHLGCASTDEQFQDDVLEAIDDGSTAPSSDFESAENDFAGEDDFSVEGAEDFSDESSAESFDDSDFAAEDFDDSEFSDEEFTGDEFGEDEFTQEDFAQEDFAEDPFAEEQYETLEDDFANELSEELTEQPLTTAPAPVAPEEPAPAPSNKVTNIKYLANESGGSVVIETERPAEIQSRLNPDTNQLVVEIIGAELPDSLKRPYILKEFEGSFGAVNAYQNPGSTTARVVVQLKQGQSEPLVQQEGSSVMVIPSSTPAYVAQEDSAPVTLESEVVLDDERETRYNVAAAEADERVLGAQTLDQFLTGNNKFYGAPISIQTRDAQVVDVLRFISDFSGTNTVISDDVKGTISVKLKEIPWDQALVTVMRARNLGYVRQGNVLRISTLENLQKETSTAKQILDAQRALTPLRVKVMPVSFAKVKDLIQQLTPFLTKGRGSVVADTRTSSLIITDTDEVIQKVARLVKELDIPPAQVMIEGKIVEASEDFSNSVGVNWGFTGNDVQLSGSGGANGGSVNMLGHLNINPISSQVLDAGVFSFGLNIGTLDFLGDLNATLALAERDSLVKIISSPRIVTMNKEKAMISQQGEQITITDILDQAGNKSQTVNRTPVELELEVTPQITADGSVIMEVSVTRQFAGAVQNQETGAQPINTREAETKVLVKNGQTAVIGGIYQSDQSEGEVGVPFLKDIPILGWLFKANTKTRQKNELLIFLTPKILNIKDQSVDS